MQKEQLLELRDKILRSTQEIALRGEGSPAERLQVLMSIIRSGNASIEVLAKAYELVQSTGSDDDKMTALLDVLYEVDAMLAAGDDGQDAADNTDDNRDQNDQQ